MDENKQALWKYKEDEDIIREIIIYLTSLSEMLND